ncbi:hypothetical protein Dimus_022551 [Dionaea muscipula]
MVSRENKRAGVMHEKLQLLRSITNSHAVDTTSIIVDASKYIAGLKEKVERLNRHITGYQCTVDPDTSPVVTVESAESGFLVNVYSERSHPGLLVSILEAFEELNLVVTEARVSCENYFQLEAVGTQSDEEAGQSIDDPVVIREAVLQAIKLHENLKESNGD